MTHSAHPPTEGVCAECGTQRRQDDMHFCRTCQWFTPSIPRKPLS